MRSASGAGLSSCVGLRGARRDAASTSGRCGGRVLLAVHGQAAVAEARAPVGVPRGVRAGRTAERRRQRDEREALEVHEVPAVEQRRCSVAVVRGHVAEPAVLGAGAGRRRGTGGGDDLVGPHPAAVRGCSRRRGTGRDRVRQRGAERDRERLGLRGPAGAGVAPAEVVVTADRVVVERSRRRRSAGCPWTRAACAPAGSAARERDATAAVSAIRVRLCRKRESKWNILVRGIDSFGPGAMRHPTIRGIHAHSHIRPAEAARALARRRRNGGAPPWRTAVRITFSCV